MFNIVYLSTATDLFTKSELLALLEQSRLKNARLEITGILLYRDGNIMQSLEGEESVVRSLMQTISEDPRHKGIMLVIQERISEREFPDWSMAFRDLSLKSSTDLPGFNQFLNTRLTVDEFSETPSKVRTLLRVFKENMR